MAQRENKVLSQLSKHRVEKKEGNETQEGEYFCERALVCLCFPLGGKTISCFFTSAGCGNDSVPTATRGNKRVRCMNYGTEQHFHSMTLFCTRSVIWCAGTERGMNMLANTMILYQTLPLFFAVTRGYRRLILAICSEDSRGAAEHVSISAQFTNAL